MILTCEICGKTTNHGMKFTPNPVTCLVDGVPVGDKEAPKYRMFVYSQIVAEDEYQLVKKFYNGARSNSKNYDSTTPLTLPTINDEDSLICDQCRKTVLGNVFKNGTIEEDSMALIMSIENLRDYIKTTNDGNFNQMTFLPPQSMTKNKTQGDDEYDDDDFDDFDDDQN